MKRLALECVAVCFAGLSATALAASKADPPTPNPDKGNQDCILLIFPDNPYANPGKMFQAIRSSQAYNPDAPTGTNPDQWVDWLVDYYGDLVSIDNVGDFVGQRCAS